MNLIPSQPHQTNSDAEYQVFDQLQEAFIGSHDYTAFHSLNIRNHQYKRFSEADFVIIGEFGLLVLEVKGGKIACNNGDWSTIDRHNVKHKIQDPFKQASTAMHAISGEIQKNYQLNDIHVTIGYGVIFPNVGQFPDSSEWESLIICDGNKFKNFEQWLQRLFKHWFKRDGRADKLSSESLKKLKQFLRPDFELAESLNSVLSHSNKVMKTLTDDQYSYLDIVCDNKQVLCSGGAGTGKTFLAVELAKRLAAQGKNVLFVCKSTWLRQYLASKITNEFVIVSTIQSVKIDLKRSGLNQYDALIIDEGQDLFNFESLDKIDTLIKDGLEDGEWYIFHDINNQSGLFIETEREAYELLKSYQPASVPLKINCRNTLPIIKEIEGSLMLEMGAKDVAHGAKVIQIKNTLNSSALANQLLTLLEDDGVSASLITILSPLCYEQSIVATLPNEVQSGIVKLDEYSIRNIPAEGVSFAEIRDFKGLENDVIIVVDLPCIKGEVSPELKTLYYVAMSRARSLLITICNP